MVTVLGCSNAVRSKDIIIILALENFRRPAAVLAVAFQGFTADILTFYELRLTVTGPERESGISASKAQSSHQWHAKETTSKIVRKW